MYVFLTGTPSAEELTKFTVTDGGDSDDEALSCSGGRRDDGCFSVRFMWRTNGAGELYTYLPPDYDENQAVCDIPPFSTCNDVYGASVGRGSFTFNTGGRTTIGQRVRLNDVGAANGELELFVAGKSLFSVGGLVLRDSSSGRIRGLQMQTFFGGEHFASVCSFESAPRSAGTCRLSVRRAPSANLCRSTAAEATTSWHVC